MKATINGITYEGTYDEITAIAERLTPTNQYNSNVPYFQFPLAPPNDSRGSYYNGYLPQGFSTS